MQNIEDELPSGKESVRNELASTESHCRVSLVVNRRQSRCIHTQIRTDFEKVKKIATENRNNAISERKKTAIQRISTDFKRSLTQNTMARVLVALTMVVRYLGTVLRRTTNGFEKG